jgi:hypothetical protein
MSIEYCHFHHIEQKQTHHRASQHIPLQNLLQSQSLLALLKLIRLQPQRLSSKLSKRSLDPLLRLRILFNRTLCTQPSSQQSSLSTHKQSCEAEKRISGNVTESGWFEHGCKVWEVLGAAVGELDRGGFFGGAEGVEHCGAVAAEADGGEEAEGEAQD